jgi:hypothetical protein
MKTRYESYFILLYIYIINTFERFFFVYVKPFLSHIPIKLKYFMIVYRKYFKPPTTESQSSTTHSQHYSTLNNTLNTSQHPQHFSTPSTLPTNMSSTFAQRNANQELVTNADLMDDTVYTRDHINRIQLKFGCSWKAAELAYMGFSLYIPHLWVGTKTHDDGRLKGEGLVYGVMRNLGLGFLIKSSTDADGKPQKAINITLREGRDGGRPFQSCLIKFDRLFTRGEENAGNIAVLEHLLAPPKTTDGRDTFNHLEVIYQEAGPSKYPPHTEAPARFWKVFLWRPMPEREAIPASPTSPPKTKTTFTLVKAKTGGTPKKAPPPLKQSVVTEAGGVGTPYTETEMADLASSLKADKEARTKPIFIDSAQAAPAQSFEEKQLAEEGFETVGKGGGKAK